MTIGELGKKYLPSTLFPNVYHAFCKCFSVCLCHDYRTFVTCLYHDYHVFSNPFFQRPLSHRLVFVSFIRRFHFSPRDISSQFGPLAGELYAPRHHHGRRAQRRGQRVAGRGGSQTMWFFKRVLVRELNHVVIKRVLVYLRSLQMQRATSFCVKSDFNARKVCIVLPQKSDFNI